MAYNFSHFSIYGTYQNSLKFMEIWRSSDRNKNAVFFDTVYIYTHTTHFTIITPSSSSLSLSSSSRWHSFTRHHRLQRHFIVQSDTKRRLSCRMVQHDSTICTKLMHKAAWCTNSACQCAMSPVSTTIYFNVSFGLQCCVMLAGSHIGISDLTATSNASAV